MSCTASAGFAAAGPIDLRALAECSLKTALSIPQDETCDRIFEPRDAAFLREARRLLIGWATAHEWTEAELRAKADAPAFAESVLAVESETVAVRSGNTAAGAGAACIDDGVATFRECAAGCGVGVSLDRIGCLMRCRQAAIESIVGCLLRNVITVFA
ncbi:MAG: hypothetical protein ACXWCO_04855 [Caldimonas sp.]